MADPVVRLTANLSPEVAASLETLATTLGSSKTVALNQAIATLAALYEATAGGGKVVIKKGNTQRAVNLPKR